MSPVVGRIIPAVPPVNPRAHADVQAAQASLHEGLQDAVNALVAVPTFPLTRSQCEHVARLVLLHALFAVEEGDVSVSELFAGLVDRLDRECWLVDGGAR